MRAYPITLVKPVSDINGNPTEATLAARALVLQPDYTALATLLDVSIFSELRVFSLYMTPRIQAFTPTKVVWNGKSYDIQTTDELQPGRLRITAGTLR